LEKYKNLICLINMPFASMIHPNLALCQFKAQLTEAGLDCRLLNLNYDFACQIGMKSYEAFARRRGVDTQIGEWFFARFAWDDEVNLSPEEFIGLCGVNPSYLKNRQEPLNWLKQVRDEVVPEYIDSCVAKIFSNGPPEVVAFSCTFYQTISSLVLAKKIKEHDPSVRIVFGGACFHSIMGKELFEKIEWIDAVSTGEADDIIIDLFQALLDKREPAGLHGILYRLPDGTTASGPPHRPVSSATLESVPDPDFDDFMKDLTETGLIKDQYIRQRIFLPFESSRGCWWGEKQHCAFCGLNADNMSYRQKSAGRVRKTLEMYTERYPFQRFFATDNNMPLSHYNDLLPDLAENPLSDTPLLFYGIKPNVTREKTEFLSPYMCS